MHIVAIDGPAGSGKSSVSKAVAMQLGFGYLDTGACYRAITWAAINHIIDLKGKTALELGQVFNYEVSLDPKNFSIRVGDRDVTYEIRTPEVSEAVSAVASLPQVRSFLIENFRKMVMQSGLTGLIVEGRDITTVVFPDAKTRILLTASEEVRLGRRSAELPEGTFNADQVTKRDENDSKVVDFLIPAPGVKLVDSTELDFEATIKAIVALISED